MDSDKGQASLEALLISAIFLSFLAMFSIPAINQVQEMIERQESINESQKIILWIEQKYDEIKAFDNGTRFSRIINVNKNSYIDNMSKKICIENKTGKECGNKNILAPVYGLLVNGQNHLVIEKSNYGITISIYPA